MLRRNETARQVKQGTKASDENMAQRKTKRPNTSCNPFKLSRDEKNHEEKHGVPLVEFEPEIRETATYVYDDRETSEMATPVSPHTLKLFEAIREDEMELVEQELDNLTDTQEIDRTGQHGMALIHVAARYNLSRIVKILLEHGADINLGTKEYQLTPLHFAARYVISVILSVESLPVISYRPNLHIITKSNRLWNSWFPSAS